MPFVWMISTSLKLDGREIGDAAPVDPGPGRLEQLRPRDDGARRCSGTCATR